MYAVIFQTQNSDGLETGLNFEKCSTLKEAQNKAYRTVRKLGDLGFEIVEDNNPDQYGDSKVTYWQLTEGYVWYFIYIMKLVDPK